MADNHIGVLKCRRTLARSLGKRKSGETCKKHHRTLPTAPQTFLGFDRDEIYFCVSDINPAHFFSQIMQLNARHSINFVPSSTSRRLHTPPPLLAPLAGQLSGSTDQNNALFSAYNFHGNGDTTAEYQDAGPEFRRNNRST